MKEEYKEPDLTIICLPDVIMASGELEHVEDGIYEGEETDRWE